MTTVTYTITTSNGRKVTRRSEHSYVAAVEHPDGRVTFHKTHKAARKAAGRHGILTGFTGGFKLAGTYKPITCSRCGTVYTELRCPGCGF